MKTTDQHYKDWSGQHHTTNSGHPVHDSAECCDFAEYYFREKAREKAVAVIERIKHLENRISGNYLENSICHAAEQLACQIIKDEFNVKQKI